MKGFRRPILAIVVLTVVALLVPLIWAGVEYGKFRKFGSYTLELPAIAAFSDSYSYSPGDDISLYVHSAEAVVGTLYRLGLTRQPIREGLDIQALSQSNRYDLDFGLNWDQTDTLNTHDLEPGLYSLELSSETSVEPFILSFILRSPGAEIGVILSTNTWDAYNSFGGISNYRNAYFGPVTRRLIAEIKWWGGQFQDIHLPSTRPNSAISEDLRAQINPNRDYHSRLVRHEWTFLAFLESQGYEYGLYTDRDFAFGSEWQDAKVLAFPGHSEYWSDGMYFSFERFVNEGGRVFMSAGNPMLKPVTYTDTGLAFHQTENETWFINELVGTSFTGAGIFTAAPFRAVKADHWIFTGADIEDGDIFGLTSSTRPMEIFQANGEPSGFNGASGLFTLKPGRGSGAFEILAVGLNEQGPAYMAYRDTGSGGWIFNSSSGTFSGSLHEDAVSGRIVTNLLDDANSANP